MVEIPQFNYPQSHDFSNVLSSYNIYEGDYINLSPMADFHLLELSSTLFTDYSQKQRLIKLPEGYKLESLDDIYFDFPDETILVKTFFYYNDQRDTSLGKRVIETRLMIKSEGIWNSATYVWNEEQNDATLNNLGYDTSVSWIDEEGTVISTFYHVPDHNECITCHQFDSEMTPLGTTQVNLNNTIERNGVTWNQLEYLKSIELLSTNVDPFEVSTIVDYKDATNSLSERGRAYLHMNCAHCHNPSGWEESSEFDMDFRYQTEFDETGIEDQANRILRITGNRRMPYIGTTLFDEEGIAILTEFIESI